MAAAVKNASGVIETNALGTIEYITDDFTKALGYSPGDLDGESITKLVLSDPLDDDKSVFITKLFGFVHIGATAAEHFFRFGDRWGRPVHTHGVMTLSERGYRLAYKVMPQLVWERQVVAVA